MHPIHIVLHPVDGETYARFECLCKIVHTELVFWFIPGYENWEKAIEDWQSPILNDEKLPEW